MIRATTAALVAAAVFLPARARAADAAAAAQTAFDDGRRLEDAGDFAGAAARFEESERLDPALGTLLNLANCYEHAGKLASAWRSFVRGAEEATAIGEAKRAQRASERAEALRARLSTIVVQVAGDVTPAEVVRLDGAAIEPSQWSEPQVVDGGAHTVVVTAPGRMEATVQVTVGTEGEHAVVPLPTLAVAPPPEATPTAEEKKPAAPAQVSTVTREAPPPARGSSFTPLRIGALATASVGVVLLGVGTAFGLQARSRWDARQNDCAFNYCNDQGYALTSQARDAANVSTWLFVAGGALAGGGLTTFLLAAPGTSEVHLSGDIAPRGGGLQLHGAF